MKILVGCEFSGTVRDAFRRRGHDAWSCDWLRTESPGQHIEGNVLYHLHDGWDLAIFHPPCTHLSCSGARWWPEKQREQAEALDFVRRLLDSPIPRIALENPVGKISTAIRKPDQIIQPWQFGHGEVKPTNVVEGREQKCWKMPPSKDRWKKRSVTYQGIADAMAAQWGF